MRKNNLLLVASVAIVLNFSQCKNYEDGPAFSLKSKTSRLTGEWELVKATGSDADGLDDMEIIFEFEKDGDAVQTYSYSEGGDTYTYSSNVEWEFSSDKTEIEITDKDNDRFDWEILRLTNKELKIEATDKDYDLILNFEKK